MTAISSTYQSNVSRVALRADLARYQKKLSDCVNCESAKTPEGKRNIQDLDTRIGALKAQLNAVPQSDATPAVSGRVDVWA
jgi:hypothetical protein